MIFESLQHYLTVHNCSSMRSSSTGWVGVCCSYKFITEVKCMGSKSRHVGHSHTYCLTTFGPESLRSWQLLSWLRNILPVVESIADLYEHG